MLMRRPSCIGGGVVAVVVDTVEDYARRLLAHIGKEAFEAGPAVLAEPPAVADSDAAAAVVRKIRFVGIVTTCLHTLPRIVSG